MAVALVALAALCPPVPAGAQDHTRRHPPTPDSLAAPAPADSTEHPPAPADSAGQEAPADSTAEESKPQVTLGGALRLNYAWQDYNQPRKDRFGDFGFEVFMLMVDFEYEDIFFSAQYRWYADFEAIRYGYIGFRFMPELELHLGIHQVPFGILPWASHSFWFSAAYYVGFEDDYDAGVKLLYRKGPLDLQAAFYKNAEYLDSSRLGRYSFDLVTSEDEEDPELSQANEEVNQVNVRGSYDFKLGPRSLVDVGASFMYGGIYNQTTTEMGDRYAAAVHADFLLGTWNLQLEGIRYRFFPENPPGLDRSTVQLGAFNFPFLVASESWVATANVAKEFIVGQRFLDSVTCYGDLSRVFPTGDDTHTSTQIVTGCMLVKGGLYIFADWITGQNMWFIGGPGVGLNTPESDEWNTRFNLNFGYYYSVDF